MVLGVISSAGDVMSLHFFSQDERVNRKVYLNVLETIVVAWMDAVSKYTFQ